MLLLSVTMGLLRCCYDALKLNILDHSYLRQSYFTFSQGPQINKKYFFGNPPFSNQKRKCRFHQGLSFGHWLLCKKVVAKPITMHFLYLKADWLIRGDTKYQLPQFLVNFLQRILYRVFIKSRKF